MADYQEALQAAWAVVQQKAIFEQTDNPTWEDEQAHVAANEARARLRSLGYGSLADRLGAEAATAAQARAIVQEFITAHGGAGEPTPTGTGWLGSLLGWLPENWMFGWGAPAAEAPSPAPPTGGVIPMPTTGTMNPLNAIGAWLTGGLGLIAQWMPWILLIALLYAVGTVFDVGIKLGGKR